MTRYRAIIQFVPGDTDFIKIETESYVLLTESVGAIYRRFPHIHVRKYETKAGVYVPMKGYENE